MEMNDRARFHAMTEATPEDWRLINRAARQNAESLPERVLAHLELQTSGLSGYAVDRFEHSLQTATRACEAGRDEEYVVCALLHDIGDTLAGHNHASIAGTILRPYVSEAHHWMVANHTVFQAYYYNEFFGRSPHLRERFRAHPHFDLTEEFCRLYDQTSFDPSFKSMPLGDFEPMVRRVLRARKPKLAVIPQSKPDAG